MLKAVQEATRGHTIYPSEYQTDPNAVPFLVGATPLGLSKQQLEEIVQLGKLITAYMDCVCELYATNEDLQKLLNFGKPENFQNQSPNYLFIRPDLIITKDGFKICEIEVSPFGLALSDILTHAYRQMGLITDPESLKDFVSQNTPANGSLVWSNKTHKFAGQLGYLADEVFSQPQTRSWQATHIDQLDQETQDAIYRGFYLHETLDDATLAAIAFNMRTTPTPTPFFEEKALLALVWDRRFKDEIRRALGDSAFEQLRGYIPPTWIVGQEEFYEPGLPGNATSTLELAGMGKGTRKVVIKESGFSSNMSWGYGVKFLDTISQGQAIEHVGRVLQGCQTHLFIGQVFCQPEKVPFNFFPNGKESEVAEQELGCRITPYYSATGKNKGELLTAKATGRSGSRYIHAASDSVNTAIGSVPKPQLCVERSFS